MKPQDCKAIRRQIEETDLGHQLSSLVARHVRECNTCREFYQGDLKLRQVVASLTPVEAPADFDFRLRAKLAHEQPGSTTRFSFTRMSYALPSAMAALLLLAGSLFVWRSQQSPTPPSRIVATDNQSNPSPDDKKESEISSTAPILPAKPVQSDNGIQSNFQPRPVVKRNLFASGGPGKVSREDFSNTGATIVRREESASNVRLPINLPVQTLKVSVDDGNGVSRTISFPTVSFGSDRVLTRTSFTSQSTARSDW